MTSANPGPCQWKGTPVPGPGGLQLQLYTSDDQVSYKSSPRCFRMFPTSLNVRKVQTRGTSRGVFFADAKADLRFRSCRRRWCVAGCRAEPRSAQTSSATQSRCFLQRNTAFLEETSEILAFNSGITWFGTISSLPDWIVSPAHLSSFISSRIGTQNVSTYRCRGCRPPEVAVKRPHTP